MDDPRPALAEAHAAETAARERWSELADRRRRLEEIVRGPRVYPVVTLQSWGNPKESSDFADLVEACRFAVSDHDDIVIESVSVGGYVLDEDEVWTLGTEREGKG